jgi:hypothetical protein
MGMRGACPVAGGIGAAFRIEWRLDLDDAGAEALYHFLDDVIAPDPQRLAHDLRRQMAIAEMPGQANQMKRIAAADFEQRLRRGHDFDQAPVFQNQCVTAAQRYRGLEVEQKRKSACARHRHPSPMAIVEIEHHGIGRRLCPAMLSLDFGRADHCKIPTAFRLCGRR